MDPAQPRVRLWCPAAVHVNPAPTPPASSHRGCSLDVAVLLDDAACADFIDRFCSDDERLGYASLLTGASRSDLFRLFWLRELGGVYADLDAELTLPLREILPLNASMLAPYNFEPEFQHGQKRRLSSATAHDPGLLGLTPQAPGSAAHSGRAADPRSPQREAAVRL